MPPHKRFPISGQSRGESVQSQGPGCPVLCGVDSRCRSLPLPWWAAGTGGAGDKERLGCAKVKRAPVSAVLEPQVTWRSVLGGLEVKLVCTQKGIIIKPSVYKHKHLQLQKADKTVFSNCEKQSVNAFI